MSNASRRRRAPARSRARWAALALGLLLALGGLWALASRGPRALDAPPLDDIDSASRARLDHVLRQADEPRPRR